MSYQLVEILGFAILIPGIIGLIRFSRISPVYYPFIICTWLGILNETVSVIIIEKGHSNAVNLNCYMLAECLLFSWQFLRWGLFKKNFFAGLVILLVATWVAEVLCLGSIFYLSSYFLVTYSFILSLLAIAMINRLLLRERGRLLKNPVFIICIAFVIYYTFSAMAEVFWSYGLGENMQFRIHVINISIITNLIANLLYSLATLWMPAKQRFTLPFL